MSEAPPKMTRFGLPVNWKSGDTGAQAATPGQAEVHAPSDREISQFGQQVPWPTCGDCKFFDLEKGQEEMMRQDFANTLGEIGWKLHHLGAPLDHIGLCGASGGQTATSTASKACDQYRPLGGRHLRVVR